MKEKRIVHKTLSPALLPILTILIFSGVFYTAAPMLSPLQNSEKAGLEQLLEQIPASDAKEIEKILNQAPAAYRAFFIKNADKIKIENTTGTQCYDAETKTVYIDFSRAGSDPRGAYTSFFHECAHAIDDQESRLPMTTLSESRKPGGKSLGKALEKDYQNFITAAVKKITEVQHLPEQSEADIEELILVMRSNPATQAERTGSENKDNSRLSLKACQTEESRSAQAETEAANAEQSEAGTLTAYLENELCPLLCTPREECLSDILGALSSNHLRGRIVTDQKIKHGYGHENSYWETDGNLEKEFFAEYFSYQMTGNREALRKIADPSFGVFPQAAAWVDTLISG